MKLIAWLLIVVSVAATALPTLADSEWYDTSKRPDLWRY